MLNLRSLMASAACALLFVSGSAWAVGRVSVDYAVVDLIDLNPGEDLQRYDYTLSGSFAQFESVELIFAHELFADLAFDVAPGDDDFAFPLLESPNPGLSADGLLLLSADRAIDSETFNFSVSFRWLGAPASPGAQPFQTIDEFFTPIGGGSTTLVPEPASWVLWVAGMLVLVAISRAWTLGRGSR